MMIYNQADHKSIERAIAKCRKVKPLVRVLGYGHFSVKGSKGDKYEVRFSGNAQGELAITCQCQGNLEHGLPCYHAAGCGLIFKAQWAAKRAAAEVIVIGTCVSCGDSSQAVEYSYCPECGLEAA